MTVRIAMALGAAVVVALAGSIAQAVAMASQPDGAALTCALVELDRSPVAAPPRPYRPGPSADAAGSFIAWDPITGTSRELLASPRGRIMAVSSRGKYAAVQEAQQVVGDRIDKSRRLIVWDLHSRQEVTLSAGPDYQVAAVAFTPHEKRLAVITWLGPVRLWDLSTGTELAARSPSR